MTQKRAHKIAKTFWSLSRKPNHPAHHRNALNQTAAIHRVSERKVHAAIFTSLQGGGYSR